MKLSDVSEIIGGGTPSTSNSKYWDGDIAWITPKDLSNYNKMYISRGERFITQEGFNNSSAKMLPENSILFTSRAPIGYIAIARNELCTNQGFKSLVCNKEKCYYMYMYYWLKNNLEKITEKANGSTFMEISGAAMKNLDIELPDINEQIIISNILQVISLKIELNDKINDNLLKTINCLYKETFNDLNIFDRADSIANISIGKTPPRVIKECFTTNEDDMKWISISDLGKCGTYIFDTNEKLTNQSVDKYNVKIIPAETIILSFKLTVGRIAITSEQMSTNEAIAHFNLTNQKLRYYLYSYLKNFDYSKLGSTSSIATAVNSKIIKAMPIGIPNEKDLHCFNEKVIPMFEKIKSNEMENKILIQLRDTILPKLMNGEIDIENIEL